MRIVAVLLAAGAGERMGGPKALLRAGDETFLARLAGRLQRPGVEQVVAVVGHDAERVMGASESPPGVRFVTNERHREGMVASPSTRRVSRPAWALVYAAAPPR